MGLVNVGAPKVEIQRQTQSGTSHFSVCRQKQEKTNKNNNFKCVKSSSFMSKRTQKLLV